MVKVMALDPLLRAEGLNDECDSLWPIAVNKYISNAEPEKVFSRISLVRFRQAIWLGLIDLSVFDCAIVVEFGMGSHAIMLAKNITYVYSVQVDKSTQDLVSCRCDYLGMKNIRYIFEDEIESTEIKGKRVLLIGIDDKSMKGFNTIINRLKKKFSISETAFLYPTCGKLNLFRRRPSQVYHVTGRIIEPFKFVQSDFYKQNFGLFKYLTYKIVGCFKHRPMIESSVLFKDSLFAKIIAHASELLSLAKPLTLVCGYFIKPLGVLLHVSLDGEYWMIRVALNEAAKYKYQYAKDLLNGFDGTIDEIPEIYAEGYFKGYYYLVESYFSGGNINQLKLSDVVFREGLYDQVFELILKIQGRPIDKFVYSEYIFKNRIEPLIAGVRGCFSVRFSTFFDRVHKYLKSACLGCCSVATISHGDYSVDNVLMNNNKITGVIDWEFAKKEGFPLVDLFFFMVSVKRCINQYSTVDAMIDMLVKNQYSEFEFGLIDRYCELLSINKNLGDFYRLITIFEFLYFRLDIDKEINRENIYDMSYGELLLAIDRDMLGNSKS